MVVTATDVSTHWSYGRRLVLARAARRHTYPTRVFDLTTRRSNTVIALRGDGRSGGLVRKLRRYEKRGRPQGSP